MTSVNKSLSLVEITPQDNDPVNNFIEKLNSGNNLAISIEETRAIIAKFEEAMLSGCGEPIEIPIEHYFSKDVYAREMRVPKGVLLTGKIHRFQNLNILSQGEVSVLSIDGLIRVKAPYTIVASPGTKRLIFTHEDTVWTTIHGTNETDVDKIEEQFIAKSYEELTVINGELRKCLG